MKQIKILLLMSTLAAMGPAAMAQDSSEVATPTAPDGRVQVAFRRVDQKDLMGNVSVVDVRSQLKQNYMTYSLENMEAWAGGFNGNSMWGMGGYLLVIDGVPREATNVLPTEIEKISFLKGVNAVALYGSRAAKGVVYITTKRGHSGAQKIDVRVNAGLHVPKDYPEFLGSAEYMSLYNEARRNDGLTDLYSQEAIYNHASGNNVYRYPNVDFYSDQYLQKAFARYDATAEISGGNDKARYYTNIGYNTAGSLLNFGEAVRNDRSDRLNLRGNVDIVLNDFITCNVDATAIFYTGKGVNTNYWQQAASLRPNRFTPLIPLDMIEAEDEASLVYVKNSNHIIDGRYLLGGTQLDQTNPFAAIYAGGNNKYTSRQFQFNTGVNADLRNVLKGLTFRGAFAVDYNASYNLAFNNTYTVYAPTWNSYSGKDLVSSLTPYGQDATSGIQTVSNSWYRQTIWATGQFNYVNSFKGLHNVSAVLLVNGWQQKESALYHAISNANLGLQMGYNYKQTYYVDFSSALVHSARLPEGNRQAFNPTVSLGWRLSNESFFGKSKVVDDLRLTASAGILHTDLDIPEYYLYQGVYTVLGSWYGWKDGSGIQATESRRSNNRDMVFPKREEVSVGVEGSFFKGALQLNANVFANQMTGIVIQPTALFPAYFTSGWPVSNFLPWENYHNDRRVGFDFNARVRKQLGEVNWTLGVSGTYYRTKATQRAEIFEDAYQYRKDKPVDGIWGLQSLGFFRDAADISASPSQTFGAVKPGDIKYKDQNGDGVIDARDEVYLGRGGWYGAPFTFGVNLAAQWKNLNVLVVGVGRFGAYAMKNSNYFWVDGQDKYSIVVRDRWTPETAETAKFPRLTTFNSDNNFRASDFWLYSTNRFDIAKVQVSYNLNSVLGASEFIKELGVYVSGFNLLTLSGERKILETNVGTAPQTRLFNLGVTASF